MDLTLQGKVALVTGGAHGLGRAICEQFAREGAKVVVNYRRSADKADATAAVIRGQLDGEAMTVRADVADEAQVLAMFETVDKTFGQVDIVVNNAALCPTCPVKDMSVEVWNETVQANLTGTFLVSREAVRRWIARERPGRIVNISSQAAFRGSTTGHAPYDASKGGIVSFTVALAREVADSGIAVNAVAPGMMHTEMTQAALDANEAKYLARIPLGRIGKTSEIADVVVFLASEAASYMTGATVDVSGGMLMR